MSDQHDDSNSRLGRVNSVVDVLAAGIALAGNHGLVTRDKDFQEIAEATGLVLESDYSSPDSDRWALTPYRPGSRRRRSRLEIAGGGAEL